MLSGDIKKKVDFTRVKQQALRCICIFLCPFRVFAGNRATAEVSDALGKPQLPMLFHLRITNVNGDSKPYGTYGFESPYFLFTQFALYTPLPFETNERDEKQYLHLELCHPSNLNGGTPEFVCECERWSGIGNPAKRGGR